MSYIVSVTLSASVENAEQPVARAACVHGGADNGKEKPQEQTNWFYWTTKRVGKVSLCGNSPGRTVPPAHT